MLPVGGFSDHGSSYDLVKAAFFCAVSVFSDRCSRACRVGHLEAVPQENTVEAVIAEVSGRMDSADLSDWFGGISGIPVCIGNAFG